LTRTGHQDCARTVPCRFRAAHVAAFSRSDASETFYNRLGFSLVASASAETGQGGCNFARVAEFYSAPANAALGQQRWLDQRRRRCQHPKHREYVGPDILATHWNASDEGASGGQQAQAPFEHRSAQQTSRQAQCNGTGRRGKPWRLLRVWPLPRHKNGPWLASDSHAQLFECRIFQSVEVTYARRCLLKDMLRHVKPSD
jgi:hypothetical protein